MTNKKELMNLSKMLEHKPLKKFDDLDDYYVGEEEHLGVNSSIDSYLGSINQGYQTPLYRTVKTGLKKRDI